MMLVWYQNTANTNTGFVPVFLNNETLEVGP